MLHANLLPAETDRWFGQYLGTEDVVFPDDYGDRATYMIHALQQSRETVRDLRASIAEKAVSFLEQQPEDETPMLHDLLKLLAEVASDNPDVHARISVLLERFLHLEGDLIRQKVFLVLGKCVLPDRDWLPSIRPALTVLDTAPASYLALQKQYPTIAPPFLPNVLDLLRKADIPTDLLEFVIQDRESQQA